MKYSLALGLVLAPMVVGCASRPDSLYDWEGYQPAVYQYLKAQDKGPEDQLLLLEEDYQKIRADGRNPPPGFHAHLGMLYSAVGKQDQAVQEFATEKQLFPESTVYMDGLIKRAVK